MRQVGSGRRNGLEEGEAAEDRMKQGGNAGERTGGGIWEASRAFLHLPGFGLSFGFPQPFDMRRKRFSPAT